MKGQNRQNQRLASNKKKQEPATKRREYESDYTDDECLEIVAQYNQLTPTQRRGGVKELFSGMTDPEKKRFLHKENKHLLAKVAKNNRKLQMLDGLEPEKPPLPIAEQRLISPLLQLFMDKDYKRITYRMLKRGIITELSAGKPKDYVMTSSVTQMKAFLKERFNMDLGPRVYVSVGTESDKLPDWLDEGPIEIYGGCANGEQRTHWIDLTTGYLVDIRKGA